MATCPDCDYEEIDADDLEEGDALSCPECGRKLVLGEDGNLEFADGDEDLDDDEEDDDEEDDDEEEADDDDDLDDSTTSTTKRRSSTSEHGGSGAAGKDQRLRELLSGFSSAIVAFSGGVDSAYLSVVATQVLGSGALCVTADSPSYPEHHRSLARHVAEAFALRHEVVPTAELERPEYRANPVNRCYYCKQELYSTLTAMASSRAIDVVLDGNNADDRGDYRPGRQAAREHGVRSPLDEVGLTKAEIRELSRAAGMATWDEPASACLSSRIPYDHEITSEKLRMVEQAEDALRALGFRVCRVRHHDTLARLELGRDEILRALRAVGYRQVAVDLQGYRMGSLNEGIRLRSV